MSFGWERHHKTFSIWIIFDVDVFKNYFRLETDTMKTQFSKTRWKRENFIERLQHEINKETQSVADSTGLSSWIILGTLFMFWRQEIFGDLHFIFHPNPHLYSKHLGRFKGILSSVVIVLLSLLGCCLFRFYKKRRINKKAEINKKNFEDEQVLVYAEEEVDVLEEEAAKVGFILILKKFEFSLHISGCIAL